MHYQAMESFSVGIRTVSKLQVLDGDDPILVGREHLFVPVGDDGAEPHRRRARIRAAVPGVVVDPHEAG